MKTKHNRFDKRGLSFHEAPDRCSPPRSSHPLPPVNQKNLGTFVEKSEGKEHKSPVFSPDIPKFHSYLSFAAGKLPLPAARSPRP